MAIDFPNSPTTGTVYTTATRSWQYDGDTWVSISSVGYTGSQGAGGGSSITSSTVVSTSTVIPTYTGYFSQYNITALAVTTATFQAPSGDTPSNGYRLLMRIKDNGTPRNLVWTTSTGAYREIGVSLPLLTTANKTTYVGCVYNVNDNFWDVIAVTTQG